MNTNFHLESYVRSAIHCIVCYCLNKLMDIQAINLPKLLLMPVHPLNPPPAGDKWLATSPVHFRTLVNHKQARTNVETPCQGVCGRTSVPACHHNVRRGRLTYHTVHATQEFLNLTPMPLIPSQEGTSQIPLLRGARGVFIHSLTKKELKFLDVTLSLPACREIGITVHVLIHNNFRSYRSIH